MNAKRVAHLTAISLSALPSAVFAAEEVRKDNSMFVTVIFLVFCALIVVAQVLPAFRSAKRAAEEERERRAARETATESIPRK